MDRKLPTATNNDGEAWLRVARLPETSPVPQVHAASISFYIHTPISKRILVRPYFFAEVIKILPRIKARKITDTLSRILIRL